MTRRRLEHDWYSEPLPDNVEIGPRAWLYSSYAFLHYQSRRSVGVRIGHDSGVYHGTFFDLGSHGQVEIGKFCSIVGAIFAGNACITIGDYAFIAHEVVIADQFAAAPLHHANHPSAESPCEIVIGENAWIGMRATLLAGAKIGAGAIVGAAAVVDFEVPPLTIVAGNPARIVGNITIG